MPPPIGYCPAVGFGGRHERSDAELLAAHVAGDRYAFDQLFRRHHRQLHRLARLTSRTSEDADDALQDAMRQRTAAPARSGTMPPSAVGCTASWSTLAWTGCVGPKPIRPPL